MIVVAGDIVVEPDSIPAAAGAAREMAEATRAEPGCISYRFYQSIEDDTVFHVFEEWESEEALSAHFETPHMAQFRARLSDLSIRSRDVKKYVVSDRVAI